MKKTVEIDLSAEEMAVAFAEMCSEDQAEFFNELARQVATWGRPGRVSGYGYPRT